MKQQIKPLVGTDELEGRLLTATDVCTYLHISKTRLRSLLKAGAFPQGRRFLWADTPRWKLAEVNRWIAATEAA